MILPLLLIITTRLCLAQLPQCSKGDLHFQFTECDHLNGRWRVEVPKDPTKCSPSENSFPVRETSCLSSCAAGQHLDSKTLECLNCPSGTFSLGGASSFTDWSHLPAEFRTYTESDQLLVDNNGNVNDSCKMSSWVAQNPSYAFTSPQPGCLSVLVYPVKLVRPGFVTFSYQFTSDADVIFGFNAQNDQCRPVADEPSNSVLAPSASKGQWRSRVVPLEAGLNILKWSVLNVARLSASLGAVSSHFGGGRSKRTLESAVSKIRKRPIVLIRSVFVNGTAYSEECSACPAGFFSNETGSSSCMPCPADTFSANKGSTTCTPCQPGYYSPAGSWTCFERPACTQTDYYPLQMPCTAQGMTTTVFHWKEPHICREDLANSVPLPQPSSPATCPPCNPGMAAQLRNGTRVCSFCPPTQYSDGTGPCQVCPPEKTATPVIDFNIWQTLPDLMKAECIDYESGDCVNSDLAWLARNSHVESTDLNPPGSYASLSLDIVSVPGSDSYLQFDFELDCPESQTDLGAYCKLYLAIQVNEHHPQVVKSWRGNQSRQRYRYRVKPHERIRIRWVFAQVELDDAPELAGPTGSSAGLVLSQFKKNIARIYSIRVDGSASGGASDCLECPGGSCLKCGPGQYVNTTSQQCQRCSDNSVLTYQADQLSTVGTMTESCEPCPNGLVANEEATDCYSNCHYVSPTNGAVYDLSPLKGPHEVAGSRLFTSSGRNYQHVINMTLCSTEGSIYSTCTANDSSDATQNQEPVVAAVCRSTIIPVSSGGQSAGSVGVYSYHPSIIGDFAANVSEDQRNPQVRKSFELAKFPPKEVDSDVADLDFVFASAETTESCRRGRYVIVTLRCSPLHKGSGLISRPPGCVDGTCDGCGYHFLWQSEAACPLCDETQFEKVLGECVSGWQDVRYIRSNQTNWYCRLKGQADGKSESDRQTQRCRVIPNDPIVLGAVAAVLGALLLLVGLLLYCWRHNRSLEYRYMRLVSGTTKDGGFVAELPQADTGCGLSDEDEKKDQHQSNDDDSAEASDYQDEMTDDDDDQVAFQRPTKTGRPAKKRLFSRFLGQNDDHRRRHHHQHHRQRPLLAATGQLTDQI